MSYLKNTGQQQKRRGGKEENRMSTTKERRAASVIIDMIEVLWRDEDKRMGRESNHRHGAGDARDYDEVQSLR